tara:strand:- start:794 stop:997 length:204 start_codon:yes stop_codon:yes gene_type:complete
MSCFPTAELTNEEAHELGLIDDQEYFELNNRKRTEALDFHGRDVCYDLKPARSPIEELIEAIKLIYK